MLLAVNTADVATPLAFVTAVFTPPANVPLAPVCAGAVNVTVTPETGLLLASFTVACSAVVNAVAIVALCGVPPVAVMLAGPDPPLVAGRTSTMLRLYWSPVGAVSLTVTVVPLVAVGLVSLCTQ